MLILGLVLLLFGLIIRISAIRSLRNNLTWRILKPTQVINGSLYKFIRHPMYLGGLFDYSGLCLLLTRNYGITIIFFIFLLNFTLDRIDREEKFLYMEFGNKYLEYMKKTKMLIPFIF